MSQEQVARILDGVSGEAVLEEFRAISDDLKELAKLRSRYQRIIDAMPADSGFRAEMEAIGNAVAVKSAEYLKERLLTAISGRRSQ